MDQKTITLELLVRGGNPNGVEKFAESEGMDEAKKDEKVTEAGIYSAIKLMEEDAEGGINSDTICPFLNQSRFTDYFSKTSNTEILGEILYVLHRGMHAMMEAYAQITAIDVLGIESLAGAIKRNIDAPGMREKVTDLTYEGYSLVFCPHDIDAEMVEHYFPIIDKWREFVKPQEIARHAVSEFADMHGLFEYDYKKEFVYKALDKLIELTDRETVSRLVYEYFGAKDEYQRFVDDKKVDSYAAQEQGNPKLANELKEYEGNRWPASWNVKNLADAATKSDKEHIAQRMGLWLRARRITHFSEVAKYEDGRLYDHDSARKALSEFIAEASKEGKLGLLERIMDLPEFLIDESNPEISGFVNAYKISQETKQEE
ncbi:hypothetical protein KY311_01990 [Candidatus Woesearchaeota archaeon]|nr:hypothetical protein [Candidatus Woesearchaeota archaeon]